MQHAADAAHSQVLALRDQFGPPTHKEWGPQQSEAYETAWRAWRDLAQAVQAAVTAYAKASGQARSEVETIVKRRARHPELEYEE